MKNKYFLIFALAFVSVALFAQDHTKTTVWKAEGDPANWQATPDTSFWTQGMPWITQKTVFNVKTMAECQVTDSVVCGQMVLGDNNPMGNYLVIKDGGKLTSGEDGSTSWAGVGYNHTALMKVEAGGTFVSNHRFHVGMLAAKSDTCKAVLEVAGLVDVRSNTFTVDHNGWSGTDKAQCWVKEGGRINAPNFNIGPNGIVDVDGGMIVVAGDRKGFIDTLALDGKLTSMGGLEPPEITLHYGWDTVTVIRSSYSPEYVGVKENVVAAASLGVFPNPATDVVQFKGVERANVNVYSITGQLVMTRENVSELVVEGLSSGLYFIEASSNGQKFVDKLLIQ